MRFTGALPGTRSFSLGQHHGCPIPGGKLPLRGPGGGRSCGLPLIATRVGGIPEIVADTDAELIEASAKALESAMRDCLDHPQVAMARAQRLKQNVADKFTVAGMTDAVLLRLKECLTYRHGPRRLSPPVNRSWHGGCLHGSQFAKRNTRA